MSQTKRKFVLALMLAVISLAVFKMMREGYWYDAAATVSGVLLAWYKFDGYLHETKYKNYESDPDEE